MILYEEVSSSHVGPLKSATSFPNAHSGLNNLVFYTHYKDLELWGNTFRCYWHELSVPRLSGQHYYLKSSSLV